MRGYAVERSKEVKDIETIQADLLNLDETQKAISGATHVYLCVGLPYDSKIWTNQWPILLQYLRQKTVKKEGNPL